MGYNQLKHIFLEDGNWVSFSNKSLKRDNELHLFRQLEQCSKKLVNCETAVEFLKLCTSFELTTTFILICIPFYLTWKWSRRGRNVVISYRLHFSRMLIASVVNWLSVFNNYNHIVIHSIDLTWIDLNCEEVGSNKLNLKMLNFSKTEIKSTVGNVPPQVTIAAVTNTTVIVLIYWTFTDNCCST